MMSTADRRLLIHHLLRAPTFNRLCDVYYLSCAYWQSDAVHCSAYGHLRGAVGYGLICDCDLSTI